MSEIKKPVRYKAVYREYKAPFQRYTNPTRTAPINAKTDEEARAKYKSLKGRRIGVKLRLEKHTVQDITNATD